MDAEGDESSIDLTSLFVDAQRDVSRLCSFGSGVSPQHLSSSIPPALHRLLELCISNEIRDYPWTLETVYTPLFSLIQTLCNPTSVSSANLVLDRSVEETIWRIWKSIWECGNEFDSVLASESLLLDESFITHVVDRLVFYAVAGFERKPLDTRTSMVDKDDTKHSAASFHSAEQANAEANLKRQEANAFCLQTCQWMVHWMYDSCVSLRRHIRQEICEKASALGTTTMSRLDKGICMPSSNRTGASTTSGAILSRDAGSSRMHTKPLLEVLLTILSGLQTSSNSVSGNEAIGADIVSIGRELLVHVFLPLHTPVEMVEWRDQIPVISSYHEVLVKCMVRLVQKERACMTSISDHSQYKADASEHNDKRDHANGGTSELLLLTVQGLIAQWPEGFTSNTPKEVLFVHELETLISVCNTAEAQVVLKDVLSKMVKCIGSNLDNIRPAQRVLQMFKNEKVITFLTCNTHESFRILLPAIYRGGELSWNPTVNKMVGLALQRLRSLDTSLFDDICDQFVANGGNDAKSNDNRVVSHPSEAKRCRYDEQQEYSKKNSHDSSDTSGLALLAGINNKSDGDNDNNSGSSSGLSMPPPHSMPICRPFNPATTMPGRGAIPMRTGAQRLIAAHNTTRMDAYTSMTITGVAPWARNKAEDKNISADSSSNIKGLGNFVGIVKEDEEEEIEKEMDRSGSVVMQKFIAKCLPGDDVTRTGQNGEWHIQQAAATPMLLPSLRFHDLVFGTDIGDGAFSKVRYARRIVMGKSQSEWPEYAVKIISAEKLHELDYHKAAEREMSILSLFAHPGICRVISSFQYTEAAYMVLEYCSRGDLHSMIMRSGAVSSLYCRFILGEVVAALHSIHESGFSYNDLKPENILVTALGHIKIADFGACRPVNEEAKSLLQQQWRDLADLRNGDWRDHDPEETKSQSAFNRKNDNSSGSEGEDASKDSSVFTWTFSADSKEHEQDTRVEGTPAYLPPEVLYRGSRPDQLSDSWALGCLAMFILDGRPAFFGDKENVLLQHEMWLESRNTSNERKTVSFDSTATSSSNSNTRESAFIDALMSVDKQERLSIKNALEHLYLTHGEREEETVSESISDSKQEGSENNAHNSNILMHPQSLHLQSVISLPKFHDVGDGVNKKDQWARRQFSVLWYAMPAPYSVENGEESDNSGRVRRNYGGHLSHNPYIMTSIAETGVERGSSFCRT